MKSAKLVKVAARLIRNRIRWQSPIVLSHLITRRCNCACGFCLWRGEKKEEMGLCEIKELYQQAKKIGFTTNYIWGGEPLFVDKCTEIAQYSSDMGFLTIINTNGYYLAERIKDLAPFVDLFIVSLDYPNEKHDLVRKRAGLFTRAVEGIRKIKEEYPQVKVAINCVLTNENKDQIISMVHFAKSLGVSFWISPVEIGLLKTTGLELGGKSFQSNILDEQKIAEQLITLKKQGYNIKNSFTYLRWMMNGKPQYTCHVPKMVFEVDCNGDVMNCLVWDKPLANVREKSLKEIVNSEEFKRQIKDAESCSKCSEVCKVALSPLWEFKTDALLNLYEFLRKN